MNNSKTLGSSLFMPYFKTLGADRDFTLNLQFLKTSLFYKMNIEKNKRFYLETGFSLTNGYKSSINQKKNINHLFLNFEKNLIYQILQVVN